MKNIFIISFSLILISAGAQNFKSDFKKSIDFYKNAKNLSMSVSVKSFTTATDERGTDLGTGLMYRSEKKYYSSFMHTEIIDDGNKVLMIDHEKKQASFYPDHSIISSVPVMDKEMDSILNSADSVQFVRKINGEIRYTCYGKKEDLIQKYHITLSEKDYHVIKIEYYYNQSNKDFEIDMYKMIVNYTSVSTNKINDTEKFKIENHINSKGNSYLLNSKYKGYKLEVTDNKKTLNKLIKG